MKFKVSLLFSVFFFLSEYIVAQGNVNPSVAMGSASFGKRISHYIQQNGSIKFMYTGASPAINNFVLIPDSGLFKTVKGHIEFSEKNQKYYIKTKSNDFYPDSIKAIVWKNNLGNEIIAMRNNDSTAWLFPVITGDINAYSAYTENQSPTITHFQKLGDTVLFHIKSDTPKEKKRTIENLSNMIEAYPLSVSVLTSGGDVNNKCYKAIVYYNNRYLNNMKKEN